MGDIIGWDVGGAHLKAALWRDGAVVDVAQWPCALWQGLDRLDAALELAAQWHGAFSHAAHAITMTGEMVDLFASRAAGVAALAAHLAARLGSHARFYAGAQGWLDATSATRHWPAVASANWLASASWVAATLASHRISDAALLVDIGSTTTDIVALRGGQAAPLAGHDAARLASGELVYLGVVRTPLMALAPRIGFRGRAVNVMNEHFATSADVFRLLGELDAAHDQQASADQAGKDEAATCQRLARMIGLDAGDASLAEWRALAQAWRTTFVTQLADNLGSVVAAIDGPTPVPIVAAGCGHFIAHDLAAHAGRAVIDVADLPGVHEHARDWARVATPALAVASLYATHLTSAAAHDAAAAGTRFEGEAIACGS